MNKKNIWIMGLLGVLVIFVILSLSVFGAIPIHVSDPYDDNLFDNFPYGNNMYKSRKHFHSWEDYRVGAGHQTAWLENQLGGACNNNQPDDTGNSCSSNEKHYGHYRVFVPEGKETLRLNLKHDDRLKIKFDATEVYNVGLKPNWGYENLNFDSPGWHTIQWTYEEASGKDYMYIRTVDSNNNEVPYGYYFSAVTNNTDLVFIPQTVYPEIHLNEGTQDGDCSDGIDNDGDWGTGGGVLYGNDGLPAIGFSQEGYPNLISENKKPDFGETNVDCFDAGCDGKPGPSYIVGVEGNCNYQKEYDCGDGYDNDFDGYYDMQDTDCQNWCKDLADGAIGGNLIENAFSISILESDEGDPSATDGSDGCCADEDYDDFYVGDLVSDNNELLCHKHLSSTNNFVWSWWKAQNEPFKIREMSNILNLKNQLPLTIGSENEGVNELEVFLNQNYNPGDVDGVFDSLTENAVKNYKEDTHLFDSYPTYPSSIRGVISEGDLTQEVLSEIKKDISDYYDTVSSGISWYACQPDTLDTLSIWDSAFITPLYNTLASAASQDGGGTGTITIVSPGDIPVGKTIIEKHQFDFGALWGADYVCNADCKRSYNPDCLNVREECLKDPHCTWGLDPEDDPAAPHHCTQKTAEITEDISREITKDSFICYDKDGSHLYAECCGPYGANCMNPDDGFIVGAPLHSVINFDVTYTAPPTITSPKDYILISQFEQSSGTERLLLPTDIRVSLIQDSSLLDALGISYENYFDLKIEDWTSYDSLEFDIAHTVISLDSVNIIFRNGPIKSNSRTSGLSLSGYSHNGNAPKTWHHISIPISDIYGLGITPDKIIEILFEMNNPGSRFALVIDNIYLKKSGSEAKINSFCSGKRTWIAELDVDEGACKAQLPYTWTGNECCGDDKNIAAGTTEYYNKLGGNGVACWDGSGVFNNQKVSDSQINAYPYILNFEGQFYNCENGDLPADAPAGLTVNKESCENPYNLITTQGMTITSSVTEISLIVEEGTAYDIKLLSKGDALSVTLVGASWNIQPSFVASGDWKLYTGRFTSDANVNNMILKISSAGTTDIDNLVIMKHNLNKVYYCSVDTEWDENSYVASDGSATNTGTIAELKDTLKTGINLVKNGEFEGEFITDPTSGTLEIGTGWRNEGLISGTDTATKEQSDLCAECGGYSQKITTAGADKGIKQVIPVEAGERYSFSALYKVNNGDIKFEFHNGNTITYLDKTDSDWTPYIRTGIIALTDRIIIIIKTTQASEFIVDNIQLEKLSTATDYVEYIKGGCCPDNLCWDGTNCVGQQEFSEYIDPATTPATGSTAYMCINGDWQSTTLKWNKGNTNWAYCPGNMCYNGAANNNIADCVDEGIYDTDLISKIQKDVCRAGGWTTEDLLDYDDELYSCSASSYADTQLGTCELPYNLITTQGLTSYTLSVESGTTYDIKALKTGADATISLTDATPASLTIDSDFYTGSFTANSNTVTLSITSGTIDDIFVMKHSLTPVYHCSVDSTWDGNSYVANDGSATSSGTIDKLKDTVQTTPSGITPASSGCCPASSCWDGTNCIESRDLILTQDYLCVDGGWIDSVEKWNPIHTSSSLYCLETECYDGTSCVEANTQSSGTDDYCEGIEDSGGIVIDTSWTSRTKRIAIQLLEFAQTKSEYALYCDEKSNALNSLEIVSGTDVTDVNNFCVLNYGDKVALGTTLNTGENLISNLADIDCSGVTADDGKFYQCDSNKAWFNPSLGGLIYQKDGITLTSTTLIGDWWTAFTGFLRGLFGGVPSTDNIAFVNKQPFDKLYIYNDDGESKKVNGVLGKEEANDFIFVEYTGFSSDLCAIINQHEDLAGYCTPSTGAAGTIFTVYVPNAQQKHKAMWQDLTSKLRIKK